MHNRDSRRRMRKEDWKYIGKDMAEDFPKLKMEKDIQVHEAQKITNKINSNSPTPRHIIIKMAKFK